MADLTCYKCGGRVGIVPSAGGRRSGESTVYRAICFGKGHYERDGCGMSGGRSRDQRHEAQRNGALPPRCRGEGKDEPRGEEKKWLSS